MTWTYSGDPSDNDRDAVRFEVGDTSSADPLVTDEEIAYILAGEGTILSAAAKCCEMIAAKFARDIDKKIESTSISASQRYKHYSELAKSLKQRISGSGTPYSGSMYVADKEADESDSSLKQPNFKLGMMDNLTDYDDSEI